MRFCTTRVEYYGAYSNIYIVTVILSRNITDYSAIRRYERSRCVFHYFSHNHRMFYAIATPFVLANFCRNTLS